MKFVKTTFAGISEILKFPDSYTALAVMMDDTGIAANADGKKIVPKGTIVGGATTPVLNSATEKVQKKNTASVAASLDTGVVGNNNAITFTAKAAGIGGNAIKVKIEDTGVNGQALDVVVDDDTVVVKAARGAGVAAFLNTGVVGNNNAITFTALAAGAAGNDIKISMIDPAVASQPLEVRLVNDEIRIQLETDANPAIVSTAAEVIAAVNSALVVKDLISADDTGASTGVGVVVAVAATALATGAEGAITSTAAQVIAAVNAQLTAKTLVSAANEGVSTGVGVVVAVAATPLAGGTTGSALSAEGVLLNDVDVTNGAAPATMVIQGYLAKGKLPEVPTAEAIAAMPLIKIIV